VFQRADQGRLHGLGNRPARQPRPGGNAGSIAFGQNAATVEYQIGRGLRIRGKGQVYCVVERRLVDFGGPILLRQRVTLWPGHVGLSSDRRQRGKADLRVCAIGT